MSASDISEASRYLVALARRSAQVYIAEPHARAAIVMGSAAGGYSDRYSDLDMSIYYDELPSAEAMQAAVARNGGVAHQLLGERSAGAFAETYLVHGVECQIAHTTIANWERDIATVLEQLDVTSPLQKALSGMLEALPIYGEPLIRRWQAQIAAYPDALAEAMVTHYLSFFPLWGLAERIIARDATLWLHQILLEAAQNILGILAGLNRLYYSTFQFKRMRQFVDTMSIAPQDLTARLETLFRLDPLPAVAHLERLVEDTVALVEAHMPGLDTAQVRKWLGWRQQPWTPVPEIVTP